MLAVVSLEEPELLAEVRRDEDQTVPRVNITSSCVCRHGHEDIDLM